MSSYSKCFARVVLAASSLYVLPLCSAQSAKAGPEKESPALAAVANSRGPFAVGDYSTADAFLIADNLAPPETGAWYLESGVKMMHLATSFANRHDPANAQIAAERAVATLQVAETKLAAERKPMSAARADELIGMISDLILHDNATAVAAYRRALVHNPNATGAKNGDARLSPSTKG